VSTTGVFCRPSCPSRTANPTNVALYDTLAAAQADPASGAGRTAPPWRRRMRRGWPRPAG
jgi:AraC family transcriptional regulator of adaptative response/methylated-DNA-[protein]-cysteine methyltransferase